MIEKCIRVVGVIVESITSVSKSPSHVDPTLPHGIPFSFHSTSVDIHRAIREEVEANDKPCER